MLHLMTDAMWIFSVLAAVHFARLRYWPGTFGMAAISVAVLIFGATLPTLY